MQHKLIMENWRKYLLSEAPMHDYGPGAFTPKVPVTKKEMDDLASMLAYLDMTGQVSDLTVGGDGKIDVRYTYEDVVDSVESAKLNLEKGDYKSAGFDSAFAVLGALAMIPLIGKYAKGVRKAALAKKAVDKAAKSTSKALRSSGDAKLIAKADEIDEKLVELPPGSSVRSDIEGQRMDLSPDAPEPKPLPDGTTYGTTYDQAVDAEKERLAKGVDRVTKFTGQGSDWYVPRKPLSKYRFVRVKNPPLNFFHGGNPELSIDKIQTTYRGHADGAGFYAATDRASAEVFARDVRNAGRGKIHKIKLSPGAKVYKIPDEMNRELGSARDGLAFIHFDKASQKALSKAGIDALYNPIQGDIIVINKGIIDSVN